MDDRKDQHDDPIEIEGLPEPPDPARVHELRKQMRQDRSGRARDVGTYTLSPMLMLAGPVVGWVLGLLVQRRWGGEPWGAVIGMLVGLVAGFRQVFLLLTRHRPDRRDRDGDAK